MIAILIIAGLLILTSVLHIIMGYIGEKKYPAPGKIAEFDDTKIHVFSKGKKEESTVPCILIMHDTADFAPALKHYELVKNLSEIKRTVIPERCGSGWSGDTFSERNADNIVFEYRKALFDAELGSKKYIIVAFGNAAVYAENWKKNFSDEVIKTIYVKGNTKGYNNIWEARIKPLLIAAARELGLLRIFGYIFADKIYTEGSDNNKEIYVDFFGSRSMSAAVRAEIEYLSANKITDDTVNSFDYSVETGDEIIGLLEEFKEVNSEADDQ